MKVTINHDAPNGPRVDVHGDDGKYCGHVLCANEHPEVLQAALECMLKDAKKEGRTEYANEWVAAAKKAKEMVQQ